MHFSSGNSTGAQVKSLCEKHGCRTAVSSTVRTRITMVDTFFMQKGCITTAGAASTELHEVHDVRY